MSVGFLCAGQSWYRSGLFPRGDEAVILFRVAAGGMAHLCVLLLLLRLLLRLILLLRSHMGQDARINVHLCLLNCGGAQLSVAGSLRNYSCVQKILGSDCGVVGTD